MKAFLNRTQLARRLNIAPETLRLRIESGEIRPDAKDGRNNDLFSETVVAAYETKLQKQNEVSRSLVLTKPRFLTS